MRLVRVVEAVGIRLGARFPRIAELRRIESDPVYRALFLAGLDAAIAERDAVREAEVETATGLLRSLDRTDSGGRTA
ncbi:hypothetical protein ABT025_10320 [Streptomyces sp. NPDC002809]|uniref:hypothetical protein n=1 Tax=Streptomyces sp. NPDC002809 TaxID=3154433 RepID=UPI003317926C